MTTDRKFRALYHGMLKKIGTFSTTELLMCMAVCIFFIQWTLCGLQKPPNNFFFYLCIKFLFFSVLKIHVVQSFCNRKWTLKIKMSLKIKLRSLKSMHVPKHLGFSFPELQFFVAPSITVLFSYILSCLLYYYAQYVYFFFFIRAI